MAKEKSKQQVILEAVFDEAINKLEQTDGGLFTAEMNLQLEMATGEIQVYDDHEQLLSKNIIYDWAEKVQQGGNPMPSAIHNIGVALDALRKRQAFDSPSITTPFSVSIVDDSFNKQQTIYKLDATAVETASEGRLMKNLERELHIFYKKIFADLE